MAGFFNSLFGSQKTTSNDNRVDNSQNEWNESWTETWTDNSERDMREYSHSYNTGSYNTVNNSTWLNIEGGGDEAPGIVDSALSGVATLTEKALNAGDGSKNWLVYLGLAALALVGFIFFLRLK